MLVLVLSDKLIPTIYIQKQSFNFHRESQNLCFRHFSTPLKCEYRKINHGKSFFFHFNTGVNKPFGKGGFRGAASVLIPSLTGVDIVCCAH